MNQSIPQWRLVAAAALLVSALLAPPAQSAGPGVNGRVLNLDEKANIKGYVSGAVIEFIDRAGKVAAKVKSDDKGFYKADLKPGTYVYKVTADGFKDENAGRGITLTLSEGYAIHDFSLIPGKTDPKQKAPKTAPVTLHTLQGLVAEKSSDGKQVGIPGATISLRNLDQKAKPQLTQVVGEGPNSKTPGHYEVSLPSGSYKVSISASGFESLKPTTIKIDADKTNPNFVLTKQAPKEPTGQGIKGVITLAPPVGSPGKRPAVKVSIRSLAQPGAKTEPLDLDASGNYKRDLAAGNYEIVASAIGYQTQTSGKRVVFRGYTSVDLKLAPEKLPAKELIFVATVYERSSKKPLPGMTVKFRKEQESLAKAQQGVTNVDGKVTFHVSAAGKYEAVVTMKGYKQNVKPVIIHATGENKMEIDLDKDTLPTKPKLTLTVHVFEEAGKLTRALDGCQVDIFQNSKKVASAQSGKNGTYEVPNLASGAYEVHVSKAQYQTTQAKVVLADKDMSIPRIILPHTPTKTTPGKVTLTVHVFEEAGKLTRALDGCQVDVFQNNKKVASAQPGKNGSYEVPNLASGAYEVHVSKPQYQTTQARVTLADKDMSIPRIILPHTPTKTTPGKVTLTVHVTEKVGTVTRALDGCQVDVFQNNKKVASAQPGKSGSYEAPNLASGAYEVHVSKSQYQTTQAKVILADMDKEKTLAVPLRAATLTPGKVTLAVKILEDATNRPVPGATIVITQKGKAVIPPGKPEPDGRYALAAGDYHLECMAPGFPTFKADITLGGKDVVSRDIHLTRTTKTTPKLTLRVVEAGSEPIHALAGATIVLTPQKGKAGPSAKSDAKGEYAPTKLAAGTYLVDISLAGHQPVRVSITVADQALVQEIGLLPAKK